MSNDKVDGYVVNEIPLTADQLALLQQADPAKCDAVTLATPLTLVEDNRGRRWPEQTPNNYNLSGLL